MVGWRLVRCLVGQKQFGGGEGRMCVLGWWLRDDVVKMRGACPAYVWTLAC